LNTYVKHPLIIGLTGSIGMGKSTVAAMFEAEGVAVFDADAAVHRLQAKGGAILPQIEAAFPGTTHDNGADRAALGALVLGDKKKLAVLEAIIHPAVAKERATFFAAHAQDDMVVFDIPLLFEKGGAKNVDVIVVVSAPATVQRERVLARPGMTALKFENILKLQMPDEAKRAQADYVIDTGCSLAQTSMYIQKLVQSLRSPLAQPDK
jgi:dephospho-CoA kinase